MQNTRKIAGFDDVEKEVPKRGDGRQLLSNDTEGTLSYEHEHRRARYRGHEQLRKEASAGQEAVSRPRNVQQALLSSRFGLAQRRNAFSV